MNNGSAKCLRRTARADLAAFYMQQAVDERIRTLAERILKAQTSTEVGNLVAQLRWVGHAAFEEWRSHER